MLRKLILVVCAMSLTLGSCGHQVTPDHTNGPSGVGPGFMQIKFNTQGTLDFVNNVYILAFNTSQTGEPYAFYATQQYNWRNLDFEIIIGSVNGTPSAIIYPFVTEPGGNGKTVKVVGPQIFYAPQDLQLYPNCNGQGTQFCLTFNRALLVTPGSPSPSPSASPVSCGPTSPTPSPTASASGAPSSSPSPSPTASATAAPASCSWYINWWVASAASSQGPGGQILDAPGPQGVLDQSFFNFNVNTAQTSSCNLTACIWTAVPPPGWPAAPTESAQISGGQVINSP